MENALSERRAAVAGQIAVGDHARHAAVHQIHLFGPVSRLRQLDQVVELRRERIGIQPVIVGEEVDVLRPQRLGGGAHQRFLLRGTRQQQRLQRRGFRHGAIIFCVAHVLHALPFVVAGHVAQNFAGKIHRGHGKGVVKAPVPRVLHRGGKGFHDPRRRNAVEQRPRSRGAVVCIQPVEIHAPGDHHRAGIGRRGFGKAQPRRRKQQREGQQ